MGQLLRQLSIYPEILVWLVHIQIWQSDSSCTKAECEAIVLLQDALKLKPGQNHVLYALYGVVEHSGTLHSGHYVAYVKVSCLSQTLLISIIMSGSRKYMLVSAAGACPRTRH
jgi:ubiquitin C-terminal hydrolase